MSDFVSFVLASISGALVTTFLIAFLAKPLIPAIRNALYGSKKMEKPVNASAAHVR